MGIGQRRSLQDHLKEIQFFCLKRQKNVPHFSCADVSLLLIENKTKSNILVNDETSFAHVYPINDDSSWMLSLLVEERLVSALLECCCPKLVAGLQVFEWYFCSRLVAALVLWCSRQVI